jgi:SAM-dependent methyltransferase
MTHSPYIDPPRAEAKIDIRHAPDHARAVDRHLRYATTRLGQDFPAGAKILDFGCAVGDSVRILLALGYDAYGVDVLEYWDRDLDKFWHSVDKPPADVSKRLKLVDLRNYRLPFENGTFDFCFSDQVFEHIFDYKTVMSEIVRVLKPRAISIHNFPGPNNLMEGHVNLPIPWLCYSRMYLTLCAWIGFIRETNADWRRRVEDCTEIMRFNNYPTKWRLRTIARSASADIVFVEVDEFIFREGSRLKTQMLEFLRKIRLDRLAARVAGVVLLQRYMVLKAAGSGGGENSSQ